MLLFVVCGGIGIVMVLAMAGLVMVVSFILIVSRGDNDVAIDIVTGRGAFMGFPFLYVCILVTVLYFR